MTSQETKIVARLYGRVAELEQMQREYNVLLNYLCEVHGDANHIFRIHTAALKKLHCGPIRTEIVDNGRTMEIQKVGKGQSPNGDTRILLP